VNPAATKAFGQAQGAQESKIFSPKGFLRSPGGRRRIVAAAFMAAELA